MNQALVMSCETYEGGHSLQDCKKNFVFPLSKCSMWPIWGMQFDHKTIYRQYKKRSLEEFMSNFVQAAEIKF